MVSFTSGKSKQKFRNEYMYILFRCMLKENASACAAVTHFIEKFDKIKSDKAQLEVYTTHIGCQESLDICIGCGLTILTCIFSVFIFRKLLSYILSPNNSLSIVLIFNANTHKIPVFGWKTKRLVNG